MTSRAKAQASIPAAEVAPGENVPPSPGADGAPVPTIYGAYPATATRGSVRLKADAHPSKWWIEQGRGGELVEVLIIEYQPDPAGPSKRVYAYDGDGEATMKFIEHAGSGAYGHREVEV